MKREVYELTELLSQVEGTDLDPDYEQKMRDRRMRWEHADTAFYAGFYSLKRLGPDDAVTLSEDISELRNAFQMLERCCKEWQEELGRVLPEG